MIEALTYISMIIGFFTAVRLWVDAPCYVSHCEECPRRPLWYSLSCGEHHKKGEVFGQRLRIH